MGSIVGFLFVFVGAFFFWLAKGLKGKFDDEMSREFDNDFKYYRNLVTGVTIISVLAIVVMRFLN